MAPSYPSDASPRTCLSSPLVYMFGGKAVKDHHRGSHIWNGEWEVIPALRPSSADVIQEQEQPNTVLEKGDQSADNFPASGMYNVSVPHPLQ